MFYRPEDDHGLPRDPFNYLVVPRPIGWISTRSAEGVDNLAPYSFFNAVAYGPPQVMFAATTGHRTAASRTVSPTPRTRESSSSISPPGICASR